MQELGNIKKFTANLSTWGSLRLASISPQPITNTDGLLTQFIIIIEGTKSGVLGWCYCVIYQILPNFTHQYYTHLSILSTSQSRQDPSSCSPNWIRTTGRNSSPRIHISCGRIAWKFTIVKPVEPLRGVVWSTFDVGLVLCEEKMSEQGRWTVAICNDTWARAKYYNHISSPHLPNINYETQMIGWYPTQRSHIRT